MINKVNSNVTWSCKPFNQLTLNELYSIMQLRQEVFVVEQNCPYLDADGKDQSSFHCLGFDGVQLVAYARLVAPNISYAEPSIGRVITHQKWRKTGLGIALMERALQYASTLFETEANRISAQCHLQAFYEKFGYQAVGDAYLEDDIPHIEMIR